MGKAPADNAILIVTGSELRAEEMDRPLAYFIREQVLERYDAFAPPPVIVVSDFRYLHDPDLMKLPTISVGGPGVNALTYDWLDELPIVLAVDDEFYIQVNVDPDSVAHASVWGMDHDTTRTAVTTFIENYLGEFLSAAAARLQKIRAEQHMDL